MTSATAPSTTDLPAIIRTLVPSGYANLADDLFAELTRRRTSDAARGERVRSARTAQLESLVIEAIQAKQARLERENRCAWTSILLAHFARRGIKAPDEETVRRVVKSFPGF
ncbi:hypothetical protein D3C77_254950 [compost metagenome]